MRGTYRSKVFTEKRVHPRHEIAARTAGISLQRLWDWKSRGEKAQSGIYREFRDALERGFLPASGGNFVRMVVGLEIQALLDFAAKIRGIFTHSV